MSDRKYGLAVLGNCLVDVLRHVPAYPVQFNEAAGGEIVMPGGSGANTTYGFAVLGGKAVFMGKVANDAYGHFFKNDLESHGVDFPIAMYDSTVSTAQCNVFITPDKERHFEADTSTNNLMTPEEIPADIIANSNMLLLESYFFDYPGQTDVLNKAVDIARKSNTKIALTLGSLLCVQQNLEKIQNLIKGGLDILIGNETEFQGLTLCENFNDAAKTLRSLVASQTVNKIVATLGGQGALLIGQNEEHHIPIFPTQKIDTTGAGDAFAAGLLRGLDDNRGLRAAGILGARSAAHVIARTGARASDLHIVLKQA